MIIKKILFPASLIQFIFFLLLSTLTLSQQLSEKDIRAQKFDMGKMWTFENPPLDYFQEEYDFRPTDEWLEKVRKSALRLSSGCSASFVSLNGLIMTNHHCVRGLLPEIDLDEENFLRDGFYAKSLDAERPIPGLVVEQLMSIEDVTDKILPEIAKGKNDSEKIAFRDEAIRSIKEKSSAKQDGLNYVVTPLYNGGRYSLYGYKKYDDLRLVFVPDLRTAKLGGDYDNFTYPRHGLDCAFLRAYENNKPVDSEFFFPWSDSGAIVEELVFVIGNPGSSERIKTIAQLEYDRDINYPALVNLLQKIYDIRFEEVIKTNAEDYELIARLYSIGNTLKVYQGILNGLRDPEIFERKKDFESQFRNKITAEEKLSHKYSHIWDELANIKKEAAKYLPEILGYTISNVFSSRFIILARDLVRYAKELKLPEEERSNAYKNDRIGQMKMQITSFKIDKEVERKILAANIDFMYERLGEENELLKEFTNGLHGIEAADHVLQNSEIDSEERITQWVNSTPDEILSSKDILIKYIIVSQERLSELRKETSYLEKKEIINKRLLGEALYDVYGESIPPDATFTLRISDGVIKSYPYNGTIAPPYTNFYGVLEKHYSFGGKFPYNVHPLWYKLPQQFDLNTPLNFISTNDIIGGNSGSPVINTRGEIVGLAFDGNYESLPNNIIYTTEANRTISVHSMGMIEAIRDLYGAGNLSNELLNGRLK